MVIAIPRPGDPVDVNELGKEHIEIWQKATGGGSAITLGLVVCLPPNSSTCAAAVTGDFGRFGVVARLGDNYDSTTGRGTLNTDTSAQVTVITNGGRAYVTGSGTIKKNSEVQAASTGKIAQYVESTWSSTTPGDFQTPLREDAKKVGVYEGHYGESLQAAGEPPTDASNAQANLILRTREFA